MKGLWVTARNFVGSYHDPARLTTVLYPEQTLPPQENARNFPFLVYDGDPEQGLRCVACLICEKECPPQCIYIVPERDAKGRVLKRPALFDIDVSVCMGCQICAEVCPFDAIKMDVRFDYSRFGRFDEFLLHQRDLARSNEYYRQIHPAEAAASDARVLAAQSRQQAKVAPAKTSPEAAGGGASNPAPPP